MRSALLASAALLAAASLPAQATTLLDTYSGGYNTYNKPGDVIGTNTFNTTSVDVTRSGPGNGTLNITVHTYFAGAPGTGAAEGTGYGALFFSTTGWSPTGAVGSSPNLYPEDQYSKNQWNYAFTMPQNPGSGSQSGTGALYAIGGNATAVPYGPNPAVPQFYKTDNGTIVMSNVNSDPVTHPGDNNPGFFFRQGQAVQYTPDNANDPNKKDGTWSVTGTVGSVEGSITFTILDDGLLGNSFALAWAMTCANDVIQGPVVLRAGEDFPTPLPAAVWLLGSVLAGGAGIGRWRKAMRARAAAA